MTPTKYMPACETTSNGKRSPVLDSRESHFWQCKSVTSPASAYKLTKLVSREQKNTVIDILDQLCSPIHIEGEGECQSETLDSVNERSDAKITINGIQALRQADTASSELKRNQSLLETANEDLNLSNSNFFDNISDISLQILCDATNQLVADSKPCETNNIVIQSKLEPQVSNNDRNKRLIYSNSNLNVHNPCPILLNNIFSEVKILEEANKCLKKEINPKLSPSNIKPIQDKTTSSVNNLFKQEDRLTLHSFSRLDCIPSKIETGNTFLNESFGISDTQFCEAVEAAELISDIDTIHSVNKYNFSNITGKNNVHEPQKDHLETLKNRYYIQNSNKVLTCENPIIEYVVKEVSTPICDNPSVSSLKILTNLSDCSENQSTFSKKDPRLNRKCAKTTKEMLSKAIHVSSIENYESDHVLKGFQIPGKEEIQASKKSLKKQLLHGIKSEEKLMPHNLKTPSLKLDEGLDESVREITAKNYYKITNRAMSKYSHDKYLKENQYMTFQKEFSEEESLLRGFPSENQIKDQAISQSLATDQYTPAIEQLMKLNTARGKSGKISEQSLKTAKQLFEDLPNEGKRGFYTASGKSVNISKQSLEKAKQLFSDLPNAGETCFVSGKTVKVSEQALEKAKHLFDDIPSVGEGGFQTASGKSVRISEQSLEKAKNLFDDLSSVGQKSLLNATRKSNKISKQSLENPDDFFDALPSMNKNGFQTASGNSVKISEQALEKAKHLFDDIPSIGEGGFQTASGQFVKISEQSLEKAKHLFDDIQSVGQIGFQTASGKSVKISEESLGKAKHLFDDLSSVGHKGFQTASGKSVKISEQSLENAKHFFNDIPNAGEKGFQTASVNSVKIPEQSLDKTKHLFVDIPSVGLKGLQTASGKLVKISEQSLEKTKHLFDDIPSVGQDGFQSASGKSMEISEQSLEKAKHLFDDLSNVGQKGLLTATRKSNKISEQSLENPKDFFDPLPSVDQKGFQTVSGKSVKISEQALEKAKHLFDDIPSIGEGGFQTASGQFVKISEQSLEKAKHLFDDIQSVGQIGFQTASGKSVKISEESLGKAKHLFDDLSSVGHKGFQTASGKSVKISEQSLENAKHFFNDIPNAGEKGFQTASVNSVKIPEQSLDKTKHLFDDIPSIGEGGFQTASEKFSKISEQSLEKAKHLLDDIQSVGQIGFQTAIGRSVKLSEESLGKVKHLFDDLSSVGQKGFQTASGKSVKISEQSLEKAKHLFDDIPSVGERGIQTASSKSVKISGQLLEKTKYLFDDIPSVGQKGFQTASGKFVKISKQSLEKAKHLFNDIPNAGENGFQTASGNSVKISERSLEKAKHLFDDMPSVGERVLQTEREKSVRISEQSLEKANPLFDDIQSVGQIGFQTASGKSVKISEESLGKAKHLFDDIPSVGERCLQTASGKSVKISEQLFEKTKHLCDDIPSVGQKGFQTASGKFVKISKQSLEKAKHLFNDIPNAGEKGFQSTSRNSVKISERSLEKAKHLFDDIPSVGERGLQTERDKSVSISEQSLEKAKHLFDDIQSVGQIGFQTTSGKSVKISEESLGKAKHLFDDIPSVGERCFQTASGKSVMISEKSLEKAKLLFDDLQSAEEKCFQTAGGKLEMSEQSLEMPKYLFGDLPILGEKYFQTASGKSVMISEQSLHEAKQLFDDLPNVVEIGFQMPCGNSVKISEEALEKSKCLFDDMASISYKGFDMTGEKLTSTFKGSMEKRNKLIYNGSSMISSCFQTGSGKPVNVSEEALIKAKEMLQEKSIGEERGFQTGNKLVYKSDNSLEEAKQTFNNGPTLNQNRFETASGKLVEISNKSLEETNKLFDDGTSVTQRCVHTVSKMSVEKAKQLLPGESRLVPGGLQMASGESVNIFEETVEKANQLYDDGQSAIQKHLQIKTHDINPEENLLMCSGIVKNLNIQEDEKQKRKHSVLLDSPSLKDKALNYSTLDKGKNVNNSSRKRRKLFIEKETMEQSNELNYCYNNRINSIVGTSVISEADLSLLNHSMNSLSGNENELVELHEHDTMSPSVAQEVSESLAALLADEASDSPFSLKPYVSSPGMLHDRGVRLPSIDCYENEIHINSKQLSPILGSCSSYKLKSTKHQINGSSTPMSLVNYNVNDAPNSSCFKPPYATSTPNESQFQLKRKSLFSNIHNQSEKRLKISLGFENETRVDISKARKEAAMKQEQHIQEKLKNHEKIKPSKGLYLLRRLTEKTNNLRKLATKGSISLPTTHQLNRYGVKKSVRELSLKNVMEFKFTIDEICSKQAASTNVNGIPAGDGALLILNEEGKAGVKEVTRAFLASPHIDPSLVSSEWVANHFKWIVLKMAAMERMFPHQFGNRYLTPDNLMLQLKYRYDREIDNSERPALRKILEKDESPGKTLVLFVADILDAEVQQDREKVVRKELELSDGWYSVRATIDHEMEMFVRSRKIGIGTKLVICGAELTNNENGCHPLETPANVRLRVTTNSTRRARWFARLGFHGGTLRPMCLREVLSRGGSVPSLTATVARSYPALFLEKVNEKTVIRSERTEQAAADAYQTKRQQCAEAILSQLQRDLDSSKKSKKQPVTRTSIKNATSTKHIYSLLDGVDDISYLQDILSKEQLNEILKLKEDETRKVQQELQDKLTKQLDNKLAPRRVTRMLKVRLVDGQETKDRSALLTVWNPSDEVVSCLTEGNLLTFYNISASGISRFGDLQLTAGKQTKYSVQKQGCCLRKMTLLSDLQVCELKPQFSEVDVVGLVVRVKDTSLDDTSSVIYFVDTNENFLGISFWTDLKATGYANTLTPGSLVAASNLHWRSHLVSWRLPTAYATEMSMFSQHPRQPHLAEGLARLRDRVQTMDVKTYIDSCQEKIESLIDRRNSGGVQQESTATALTEVVGAKQLTSRSIVSGSSNPSHFLDRPNLSVTEALDTPTNRRIEMLERYGEPPPISPLCTSTPTAVKRSFRPPKRKSTDR